MDFSHPAYSPYLELLALLPKCRLPSAMELSALAREFKLDFEFAESEIPLSACDYERRVQETGTIATRPENLHDFMNALVWLAFPAFKAALNRAHCRALADNPHEARQRSPLRDALTVLDESGVLVLTEDAEFSHLLINRRWQELFVGKRRALAGNSQFIVVGHSILEKLLCPYPSITGKCLVVSGVPTSIALAEPHISRTIMGIDNPRALPPMPVAGIPGWHPENHLPHFYDDSAIFRPLAQ